MSLVDGPPLLRPDEQIFEAMLTGWRHQQLARNLAVTTIVSRERLVRRFQAHVNLYPWEWLPVHLDEWSADLRSIRHLTTSTVRSSQFAVRWFCEYVCHPAYAWVPVCETQFGNHPIQIALAENTAAHVSDHEGRPIRKALTRGEVQSLFDAADDETTRARNLGRKNWLSWFRDATLLKVTYAFGLRRNEVRMLDVADFSTNPRAPEFGDYGACRVRFGKAMRGSPPKRRTVLCVHRWVPEILEEWVDDIRPRYEPGISGAMWPSERTIRIGDNHIGRRFAALRDQTGLPAGIGMHSLRHSYVTHLIEDGWDAMFVQQQVGHEYASTTALYTSVSSDFRTRAIRAALDRITDPVLKKETH